MCIPDTVWRFTKDDIHIPKMGDGYTHGDKKTPIGWLLDAFYPEDNNKDYGSQGQHIADYHQVQKALMEQLKFKGFYQLLEWEETTTPTKAASALNKLFKSMGYTEDV